MYSPSVFLKDGLNLYVFESLKLKLKLAFEEKLLECLKFGLSCGKNGHYALCEAIYTHFQTFLEFTVRNKKKC